MSAKYFRFFTIIILILFLFSCHDTKKTKENGRQDFIRIKDSLVLDIPFLPRSKYIYSTEWDGKEALLIIEPMTLKKILVFDINGNPVDTVDISHMVNRLKGQFENMSVFSRDSILFYTYAQIIMSDSHGKVFKLFNLKDMFNDEWYFFLNYFIEHNLQRTSFLISNLGWLGKRKGKRGDSIDFKRFKKPDLAIISKGGRIIKILSYDEWFSDHPFYETSTANIKICRDGHILLWIPYTNKLVFMDTINFEMEKKWKIQSESVKSYAPMLPPGYKKKTTYYRATHGAINDIEYNPKEEKYYVLVQDSVPGLDWNRRNERKYALLIYDKQGKKREEKIIPAGKYIPYANFVSDKGFWILRKYDYDKKKLVFDLVD